MNIYDAIPGTFEAPSFPPYRGYCIVAEAFTVPPVGESATLVVGKMPNAEWVFNNGTTVLLKNIVSGGRAHLMVQRYVGVVMLLETGKDVERYAFTTTDIFANTDNHLIQADSIALAVHEEWLNDARYALGK